MDFLSTRVYDAYATACAGRAGLRVQWDAPNSVPRTDGSVIYLPRLSTGTPAETVARLRYLIKHETSHVVHSDFNELKRRKLAPNSKLAMVSNLIEDMRIDYLNDREYRGDVQVVEEFVPAYLATAREKVSSNPAVGEVSPLIVWVYMHQTWYVGHEDIADMFAAIPTSNAHLYPILEGFSERLVSVTSSADPLPVWSLAEDIVRALWPDEKIESPEEREVEAEGGDGSGDGEGDEEGESGGRGKGDGGSDDTSTVDVMEIAGMHSHSPSARGSHLLFDDKLRRDSWVVPSGSDYREVRNIAERHVHSGFFDKSMVANVVAENGRTLGNRLRIHLQTMARDRYTYGQRKGKLHSGSLHRVLSDNAKQAERVFKQRVISNTIDTAITLLVDCSGSMCGNKYMMASAAAITMSEALTPLRIPHNILGFTTTDCSKEYPLTLWFKEWGENAPASVLMGRMAAWSDELHQNADGDSVAYAYAHLMQRKETRKMLLVFSDGSPCGRDWAGDGYTYLKKVCTDIEDAGIVDLYGIGIEDSNVTRFYKQHAVINNLAELSPKLLEILGSKL